METELLKQYIDEANGIANQLSQTAVTPPALPIVLEQLAYLKQIYDRDGNFQAVPKGKLTIGILAAKNEYDAIHPRLADLLYDIDYAFDNPDSIRQGA